mmetsp:Transcript_17332/g.48288  ORF Transcript_17332/g.48288 Transcript_17332/m.48288 type:complete len:310 (+) Transcript_17332:935-1864(+)
MSRPLPWVIRLSSSLEMGEGPGAVSSSAGRMSVVPSLGSAGTLARLYSMTSTTASSSVSDLISNSSCWPMRCRHRGLLNITWSARSCSACRTAEGRKVMGQCSQLAGIRSNMSVQGKAGSQWGAQFMWEHGRQKQQRILPGRGLGQGSREGLGSNKSKAGTPCQHTAMPEARGGKAGQIMTRVALPWVWERLFRSVNSPTVLRATAMVPKAMVETTPRGPCGGLAPRLPLLPPSPISARNSFTSGGSMPPSSSSSPASSLSSGGPAEAPCVPVTRERTVRILRRVSSLAVRRLTIAALISNLSAASSMS